MVKKTSYATKIKIKLGMSLFSLAAALSSLGYVTYAWFVFTRSQNLDVLNVAVEQGLTYSLKYYVGNGEEGYPGPDYSSSDTNATVTNYGSEFLPVSSNFHELLLPIKQPKYRLTYALEVYAQDVSSLQTIDVTLASFDAPPSSFFYDVDTEEAISLASAINIYAIAIDGDVDNAAKSTLAAGFVEASSPSSDKFDGSEGAHSLATSPLVNQEGTQTRIFFITIEFSGDSSTFYDYVSQDGGIVYFDKSPSGNSNVYQGLQFTLNSIVISKS